MEVKAYGNNILIKPFLKSDVLLSDTGTLCLYGEILSIGDDVKDFKVGDIIGHTEWGVNRLVISEDEKYYFVPEDPRFILGKLTM